MEDKKVCKHEEDGISSSLSFCKKCGVIMSGKIHGFKTKHYQHKPELCLSETLQAMISFNRNLKKKPLTQKYGGFRLEILAFVKALSKKLRLQTRTYYLACSIVDRIFQSIFNSDFKPAITAVSSIFIAAKFHELDISIHDLKEFEVKGKKYMFPIDQIKKYEVLCIKGVDYNVLNTSVYDFIKFFLGIGSVLTNDKVKSKKDENCRANCSFDNSLDCVDEEDTLIDKDEAHLLVDQIYSIAYNALEICILEKEFLDFTPLYLACACVAFARSQVNIKDTWNDLYKEAFKICLSDFDKEFNFVKKVYESTKEPEQKPKPNTSKDLPKIDLISEIYNEEGSQIQSSIINIPIQMKKQEMSPLIPIPLIDSSLKFNQTDSHDARAKKAEISLHNIGANNLKTLNSIRESLSIEQTNQILNTQEKFKNRRTSSVSSVNSIKNKEFKDISFQNMSNANNLLQKKAKKNSISYNPILLRLENELQNSNSNNGFNSKSKPYKRPLIINLGNNQQKQPYSKSNKIHSSSKELSKVDIINTSCNSNLFDIIQRKKQDVHSNISTKNNSDHSTSSVNLNKAVKQQPNNVLTTDIVSLARNSNLLKKMNRKSSVGIEKTKKYEINLSEEQCGGASGKSIERPSKKLLDIKPVYAKKSNILSKKQSIVEKTLATLDTSNEYNHFGVITNGNTKDHTDRITQAIKQSNTKMTYAASSSLSTQKKNSTSNNLINVNSNILLKKSLLVQNATAAPSSISTIQTTNSSNTKGYSTKKVQQLILAKKL